jgi:hypothetical protein
VNRDCPYSRATGGEKFEFSGESTPGGTSAQELKLPKLEDPKWIEVIISLGRHTPRDHVFWVKELQEKRVHIGLKLPKPE